ncbi:cyclin-dependent kinase-like 4 isoform X2 [Orussus abietinus]|uniref:cyclin-dependent kinase-like 4 isoform X2 n=1 Tax=Orussus abietinus TaxID=222816 RepID=UPI00062608F9|nr:cyclin-dependent kinase-like 4 isoform X2 [Orussus abietinus]
MSRGFLSDGKAKIARRTISISGGRMDKYENLEIVGEGSYGVVMKCKHKETGQIVAIKKFLETEEDAHVRKMAFREIRMLKKLRHENLVNMIEVFRRRKRLYLVFEYLDHTVLDELEAAGGGLGLDVSRRHIFQVLRGLNFCHVNHIMHRDVKPENILVSPNGVVKLCDFGFARFVPGPNESCTDYVATRWYRAPELLVGDPRYGKPIDVWAVGCLYAEMVNGDPLFPGESDMDQLFQIMKLLGGVCGKHQTLLNRNGNMRLLRRVSFEVNPISAARNIRNLFPSWNSAALDFLIQCLRMDPDMRPSCSNLLHHPLFIHQGFAEKFLVELQHNVAKEMEANPLVYKRDRRPSVLSTEDSSKISSMSSGRWQTCMAEDSRGPTDKSQVDNVENDSLPTERVPILPTSRQRELCYFGPVSVIPNTTYIRRLQHKGLVIPNSKGFSLPALPPKESYRTRIENKRKRFDLPNVDR